MKKKITMVVLFACLMLIGITGTFWGSPVAEAAVSVWNSCEHGRVDCPYPGDCRSYVDTNSDGICDRSQSEPETTALEVSGTEAADGSDDTGLAAAAGKSGGQSTYNFVPILLAAAVLYALTWILSKKGVIRQPVHRRIWNLVLLVATIVSVLLGLFLILNLDFNTGISLPVDMLFWHVEAGIAMGIVAVFHVIWHWRYFVKIFKTDA